MCLCLFLIAALLPGPPNAPSPPTIKNIVIEGNLRIPASTILLQISEAPNCSFDPVKSQKDLRKLYSLGVFEDVQVQSREVEHGQVELVFRVHEYPFLSSFSIKGVDDKLEKQIRDYLKKEKLELQPATPYKPAAANRAAIAARNFLRSRKYPNADIQVTPERQGDLVRVLFNVQPGERLEIGAVRFAGNHSIPSNELLKQMKFARPAHFWARWTGAAHYVPEELQADIERIQFYYKSRGFAAARVGKPKVFTTIVDSRQIIEIDIPIVEGERYRLASVKVEGHIRTGASDVDKLIRAINTPSEYNYSILDSTRQKILNTLGHHGYARAYVQLEQIPDENDRTIQAVYKVTTGDAVVIGRIEFNGNNRVPDKFLRRELRVCEGEIFDTFKLDQSVAQLNKSNLLQEVRRKDAVLKFNEETNLLDVTFNVKEKERHGIYATGGTGGISGGYLGLLYTAFNFLHLGESLSLELDGGASQSNMLLNIVGTHFLGSPFTLALSIFNRYAGFNVANIVPGPEALVGVLKNRSRGVGLSGTYPITGNLQVGMGFEAQRDTVTGANAASTGSLRSEVAPFVQLDRTRGMRSDTRGYLLSYSQSWDGSLFLKSLDSTRESLQFARYMSDPWTKGRNSLVFHLEGSWVRPRGGNPLFLDRMFYPGDESVRGFHRGSLSPWALTPGNSAPQPVGADTVLGFSTEYRVPIAGALSGAGFFDLGWTHLNPQEAVQLGDGARLIDATNGILRASSGGELRLQLPVIRQPVRMIFSWNPLRLDTLLSTPTSVLHLAEPKTTLRFALGAFY
jgi:outer membrane protein assembly complex protein YaeT